MNNESKDFKKKGKLLYAFEIKFV